MGEVLLTLVELHDKQVDKFVLYYIIMTIIRLITIPIIITIIIITKDK
jgi:hypothetical protein